MIFIAVKASKRTTQIVAPASNPTYASPFDFAHVTGFMRCNHRLLIKLYGKRECASVPTIVINSGGYMVTRYIYAYTMAVSSPVG